MDQAFHHFPGSPLEFWLEENRSRLAGTTGQTDPGSSPSPDPLRLGHGNSHANLVALPDGYPFQVFSHLAFRDLCLLHKVLVPRIRLKIYGSVKQATHKDNKVTTSIKLRIFMHRLHPRRHPQVLSNSQ
jgi:hypothetical protein